MKLARDAVRQAVRAHFGEELAAKLKLPDDVDDADLAAALLAALGIDQDLDIATVGVSLITPGRDAVFIAPGELAAHPLIPDWMAGNLADALARLVLNGSRLYSLSPDGSGCPDVRVTIIGPERRLVASIEGPIVTAQGMVTAVAHYGGAVGAAAFSRSVTVSGGALFLVGRDARRLTAKSAPAERPEPVTLH